MKPAHLKKALLLPTVLLTLSLISCVDPSYSGGYNSNSSGPSYASTGFNTYTTLPTNYSGNAYLLDGRYYSGGQYQTGNYIYQGRSYPNRYSYNGRYYYGGDHRAYGSTIGLQTNGFNTYTTLPTNYSGNAYLLDGRYYSGGQYQTGNYSYQGRSYPNRYSYNGRYYYGGDHRAYGSTVALQTNGFNTYTTLPTNYSGNAYLLGGRYYSGGQYQTGNYSYQGRSYPNRYNYNGQYYYGGDHRAYGSTIGLQNNGYIQQSRY